MSLLYNTSGSTKSFHNVCISQQIHIQKLLTQCLRFTTEWQHSEYSSEKRIMIWDSVKDLHLYCEKMFEDVSGKDKVVPKTVCDKDVSNTKHVHKNATHVHNMPSPRASLLTPVVSSENTATATSFPIHGSNNECPQTCQPTSPSSLPLKCAEEHTSPPDTLVTKDTTASTTISSTDLIPSITEKVKKKRVKKVSPLATTPEEQCQVRTETGHQCPHCKHGNTQVCKKHQKYEKKFGLITESLDTLVERLYLNKAKDRLLSKIDLITEPNFLQYLEEIQNTNQVKPPSKRSKKTCNTPVVAAHTETKTKVSTESSDATTVQKSSSDTSSTVSSSTHTPSDEIAPKLSSMCTKKKRSKAPKAALPADQRCLARLATGCQCTSRRHSPNTVCKTHSKYKYGLITDPLSDVLQYYVTKAGNLKACSKKVTEPALRKFLDDRRAQNCVGSTSRPRKTQKQIDTLRQEIIENNNLLTQTTAGPTPPHQDSTVSVSPEVLQRCKEMEEMARAPSDLQDDSVFDVNDILASDEEDVLKYNDIQSSDEEEKSMMDEMLDRMESDDEAELNLLSEQSDDIAVAFTGMPAPTANSFHTADQPRSTSKRPRPHTNDTGSGQPLSKVSRIVQSTSERTGSSKGTVRNYQYKDSETRDGCINITQGRMKYECDKHTHAVSVYDKITKKYTPNPKFVYWHNKLNSKYPHMVLERFSCLPPTTDPNGHQSDDDEDAISGDMQPYYNQEYWCNTHTSNVYRKDSAHHHSFICMEELIFEPVRSLIILRSF